VDESARFIGTIIASAHPELEEGHELRMTLTKPFVVLSHTWDELVEPEVPYRVITAMNIELH
jgi:hypothetical protein